FVRNKFEMEVECDLNTDSNDGSSQQNNKLVREPEKVLNVKEEHRGIIYLSFIPPGLNVQKVRKIFSEFGEVTNIYLEPEKKHTKKGNKKVVKVRSYTEGWVEFRKKKIAKKIAAMLNGRQVGGKRRHQYYDSIWNIKYLHRFKWSHLRDQLDYEKALRDQRLRLEVGQAKKEANFYINMHEEFKRRNKRRENVDEEVLLKRDDYYRSKQRQTDEKIREQKNETIEGVDVELLKKIFK
ncbi:activator of basal transcription-like protein, partial [Leptotrombidium deliense]